jgi:hypothetical protein
MIKTLDIAVLVLGLSVVAAVSYAAYWRPHRGAGMVSVRTSTAQWIFPLEQNRRFIAEGPGGACQVVISSGMAWVERSDCPQKICVQTGIVSQQGQWIICLPHRVFIRIEGGLDRPVDAISS